MSKKKEKNEALQQEDIKLDELLETKGLKRKIVPKDGACLFRAISDHVFHKQATHQQVRTACVEYLQKHKGEFEHWIYELPFDHYCALMKKDKTWGGQVEIEVLSRLFRRNIVVYSIRGVEAEHNSEFGNTIHLSFSHGNHYDSVYSSGHFEVAGFVQDIIYDALDGGLGMKPERDRKKGTFKNGEYDAWKQGLKDQHKQDSDFARQLARNDSEGLPPEVMAADPTFRNLSGYHNKNDANEGEFTPAQSKSQKKKHKRAASPVLTLSPVPLSASSSSHHGHNHQPQTVANNNTAAPQPVYSSKDFSVPLGARGKAQQGPTAASGRASSPPPPPSTTTGTAAAPTTGTAATPSAPATAWAKPVSWAAAVKGNKAEPAPAATAPDANNNAQPTSQTQQTSPDTDTTQPAASSPLDQETFVDSLMQSMATPPTPTQPVTAAHTDAEPIKTQESQKAEVPPSRGTEEAPAALLTELSHTLVPHKEKADHQDSPLTNTPFTQPQQSPTTSPAPEQYTAPPQPAPIPIPPQMQPQAPVAPHYPEYHDQHSPPTQPPHHPPAGGYFMPPPHDMPPHPHFQQFPPPGGFDPRMGPPPPHMFPGQMYGPGPGFAPPHFQMDPSMMPPPPFVNGVPMYPFPTNMPPPGYMPYPPPEYMEPQYEQGFPPHPHGAFYPPPHQDMGPQYHQSYPGGPFYPPPPEPAFMPPYPPQPFEYSSPPQTSPVSSGPAPVPIPPNLIPPSPLVSLSPPTATTITAPEPVSQSQTQPAVAPIPTATAEAATIEPPQPTTPQKAEQTQEALPQKQGSSQPLNTLLTPVSPPSATSAPRPLLTLLTPVSSTTSTTSSSSPAPKPAAESTEKPTERSATALPTSTAAAVPESKEAEGVAPQAAAAKPKTAWGTGVNPLLKSTTPKPQTNLTAKPPTATAPTAQPAVAGASKPQASEKPATATASTSEWHDVSNKAKKQHGSQPLGAPAPASHAAHSGPRSEKRSESNPLYGDFFHKHSGSGALLLTDADTTFGLALRDVSEGSTAESKSFHIADPVKIRFQILDIFQPTTSEYEKAGLKQPTPRVGSGRLNNGFLPTRALPKGAKTVTLVDLVRAFGFSVSARAHSLGVTPEAVKKAENMLK